MRNPSLFTRYFSRSTRGFSFRAFCFSFLAFCFSLHVAGCGLFVPEPATEPASEPATSSPEPEAPAFSSCEGNNDCRGGEICVDLECRTSCDNNDDCSGFYGVCDPNAGICVACLTNEDCESDEHCTDENQCAFFCSAHEDCATTEYCDVTGGECKDRECEENSDCQGGFACEEYRCVSILDLVCEANEVACEGTNLVTCNADGTSKETQPCGGGNVCVPAQEGATCEALACEANAIGCIDDDNAFYCNTAGTEKTTVTCGSTQYCQEGICREEVCVPSSVSCDDNRILRCDEVGATQEATSCLDAAECSSDFGCQCTPAGSSASCVARVCVPGVGQCIAGGFRLCNDDGSDFLTPVDCLASETCVSGSCVSSSCVAGTSSCSANVLLTCNQAGNGYDVADCADNGGYCFTNGSSSQCQTQACTPNAISCTLDGQLETCDAQGASTTVTTCETGKICVEDACIARVCMPDATRCEGSSVATCNGSGTAEVVAPCDTGSLCIGGVCEAPVANSCAGKCGNGYNPNLVCQCNDSCANFGNCCSDFSEVCAPPNESCVGLCGTPFDGGLACQCNDSCIQFGSCCDDFEATCGAPNLSCTGRCGGLFDENAACQCNAECLSFGNCCNDFIQVCGPTTDTWLCPISWQNDGECDCGCGIHDTDCDASGATCMGCGCSEGCSLVSPQADSSVCVP